MCNACTTVNILLGVIAVITTLVSLVGVYMAHFLSTGLTFGTPSASFALIALTLNLFLVKKMASCCPCECALPAKK